MHHLISLPVRDSDGHALSHADRAAGLCLHRSLELLLLISNAGRRLRAQRWRVTSINDRLREVIELGH